MSAALAPPASTRTPGQATRRGDHRPGGDRPGARSSARSDRSDPVGHLIGGQRATGRQHAQTQSTDRPPSPVRWRPSPPRRAGRRSTSTAATPARRSSSIGALGGAAVHPGLDAGAVSSRSAIALRRTRWPRGCRCCGGGTVRSPSGSLPASTAGSDGSSSWMIRCTSGSRRCSSADQIASPSASDWPSSRRAPGSASTLSPRGCSSDAGQGPRSGGGDLDRALRSPAPPPRADQDQLEASPARDDDRDRSCRSAAIRSRAARRRVR